MRRVWYDVILAIAVLFGALLHAAAADAQSVSEADRAALAGPWQGEWSGGGFVYDARMTLNADADGAISGSIFWTLRVAAREPELGKIGATGTEMVRGRFLPDTGLVIFAGYAKDDPEGVVGLDEYRLLLSETRMTMGGLTYNHGPWDGRFFLSR